MKNLIFILIASGTIAGCVVSRDITASLQDRHTGSIQAMQIRTEGQPKSGTFTGRMTDGELFQGQYTALVGGVTYEPTFDVSKQVQLNNSNANVTMMGVSNKGTSLNCQLISNRSVFNPHGTGLCSDNRGRSYNVVF